MDEPDNTRFCCHLLQDRTPNPVWTLSLQVATLLLWFIWHQSLIDFFFLPCLHFFYYLRECAGQLARTTTNPTIHWTPCKPNRHVKHRGGDRHAHKDSNLGAAGEDKPLPPLGQDPQCISALEDIVWWQCSMTKSLWQVFEFFTVIIFFIWKYIKILFL